MKSFRVEAQPRRSKSKWAEPVSRSRTALGGARAAGLILFCLLLTAYFLPAEITRQAFSQNQPPPTQPQPSPTPTPSPTPAPSPTPPPNLHQWGAVTSFHGLPSDRAHAIAQTEFGVTWFATDRGLARYDGRRTNAINADGLPAGRVLALKTDPSGALWIGTDNGAAWMWNGKFHPVKETTGKVITAIIIPERDRAIMASESGQIFDCRANRGGGSETQAGGGAPELTLNVQAIPGQPLQSADKDQPGPLKFTSLAFVHNKLYAGTQSRGLVEIENGEVKEVVSRPRSYFINALETDAKDRLWVGARARAEESGLFDGSEPLKPIKSSSITGAVKAIARGARDDIWIATDGHGAFRFQNGKRSTISLSWAPAARCVQIMFIPCLSILKKWSGSPPTKACAGMIPMLPALKRFRPMPTPTMYARCGELHAGG